MLLAQKDRGTTIASAIVGCGAWDNWPRDVTALMSKTMVVLSLASLDEAVVARRYDL